MTDRLDHCGAQYGACGECVSGYPFPETVPKWLNSPGHRRIILDPQYTHGGAAESRSDATGRPYTTCVFYSIRTGRRAIVVPEYGGVTEDMIPGEA
jgi:uncharacterized protein YkwD